MPAIILNTPDNSTCPSDTRMEDAKTLISRKIGENLAKIAARFTACGGTGWRQVASLDMTDPNQICPQAWRLYDQDSVRACGRQISSTASCDSVQYSPKGYAFTEICGKITGYQYGSPDGAFHFSGSPTAGNEINEPYFDGVSVTIGTPRQHIWTLYGGSREFAYGCCDGRHINNNDRLGFVGNNYFCDTGNIANGNWYGVLFTEHHLWDGFASCPSNNDTCCAPHSGPWFHVTLTALTIDDIEIRICGDQDTNDEDTPLEMIEIYIK